MVEKIHKLSGFVMSVEVVNGVTPKQYAVRIQTRDAHPTLGAMGDTIHDAACRLNALIDAGHSVVDQKNNEKWAWDKRIFGWQKLV